VGATPVQVQTVDEVFIRCRRDEVNAIVAHVPTWPLWWPGLTATPAEGRAAHVLALRTPWRLPRRHEVEVEVARVRPRDKGVELVVRGDLEGDAEWYHLDRVDGVVVHWVVRGRLRRRDHRRWVAAHRASVRGALISLKARLERGRPPGAEPDPRLLAHQAAELAILAEERAATPPAHATPAAPAATAVPPPPDAPGAP
jgi:hypothetical protein